MGIFRRKAPRHYIEIHPDNIATKDWIVLLEAGTIVGRPAAKLRVAAATLGPLTPVAHIEPKHWDRVLATRAAALLPQEPRCR